ncbi:MAG: hypothetical protein ACLRWQ_03075 [Flavonifractor plautii]
MMASALMELELLSADQVARVMNRAGQHAGWPAYSGHRPLRPAAVRQPGPAGEARRRQRSRSGSRTQPRNTSYALFQEVVLALREQ